MIYIDVVYDEDHKQHQYKSLICIDVVYDLHHISFLMTFCEDLLDAKVNQNILCRTFFSKKTRKNTKNSLKPLVCLGLLGKDGTKGKFFGL